MKNKADEYCKVLDEIYAKVDREAVFSDLEPENRRGYIWCICPSCGQRRAFIYEHGKTLKCNRRNSCSYETTILQYVAGCEKPRGQQFIQAVEYLARLAEIRSPSRGVTPIKPLQPIKKNERKEAKPLDPQWLKKVQAEVKVNLQKSGRALSYLQGRRIPFELALKFGLGFAPYGRWPHYNDKGELIRQWRPGRITVPILDRSRQIMNIYGRVAGDCPKWMRHDFFDGVKGVWNVQVLDNFNMVYITEGIFDALSMIAAKMENVCAINGCHQLPWGEVKAKILCFALDPDTIGGNDWKRILTSAFNADKKVVFLPKSVYGGYKDLNHLWQKTGRIRINTQLFIPSLAA